MEKEADWTDSEWAEYLGVSNRTARGYFKKNVIYDAKKTPQGEWRAAGNGLNKFFTFQNMAQECGWEQDADGSYIDPRMSVELKAAFKPLFDSRKERTLRYSRMLRIASAYKRAVNQLPIESEKLDRLEEATRWMPSSPTPSDVNKELEIYLPDSSAIKFIKAFFDNGLLKRAELLVAMVSAITRDGKSLGNQLPSAYDEWRKIRGHRSTGKLIRTYAPNTRECLSLLPEVKPNKCSKRQFKLLIQRYGR